MLIRSDNQGYGDCMINAYSEHLLVQPAAKMLLCSISTYQAQRFIFKATMSLFYSHSPFIEFRKRICRDDVSNILDSLCLFSYGSLSLRDRR